MNFFKNTAIDIVCDTLGEPQIMHESQVKARVDGKTETKIYLMHIEETRKNLKKDRVVCVINYSSWWKRE